MNTHSIKFSQIIGGLAKVEGSAGAAEDGIEFELAMTESIKGPVKGVLKRSVPYASLEEVEYSRRLFRDPVLKFIARSMSAFESIPGAAGFDYAVTPAGKKAEINSFVTEVRLAIAEATTERFTRQIEGHSR